MQLGLAWLAAISAATAAPDVEQIRRTATEVTSRPEFQNETFVDPRSTIFLWLLEWLAWLLRPVFRFFGGLWSMSPVLAVIVATVLVVILLALVAHIIYTFRQAMQVRARAGRLELVERQVLDPRTLEIEAEEAAHHHDYIRAVRLLFRATLLRLDQNDRRGMRPGITNREYLRRYRDSQAYDALRKFVDIIDAKWYGYGECDLSDYLACHSAHAQLLSPGGIPHAHRA